MAIINHIRKLNREDDGVSLQINLEDWATDVPLPPHTSLLGFGENYELLIYPEWRFVFRPNETYDVLTGMFKVPMPFADAVAWSQSQLKKRGGSKCRRVLLFRQNGRRLSLNFRIWRLV